MLHQLLHVYNDHILDRLYLTTFMNLWHAVYARIQDSAVNIIESCVIDTYCLKLQANMTANFGVYIPC